MLFFSSFVNQMPVVHPHTWARNRAPQLLAGAMQACGALYVKTRVANAFITSTLAQARDPLVAQFVRVNIISTITIHLTSTSAGERNGHSERSDIHDFGCGLATDIRSLPPAFRTTFNCYDVSFYASSCQLSRSFADDCTNSST